MKFFLLFIFFIGSNAHAGIFGVSTYEECVDEVVKNAKIKEALYEGQSNCYERYIRPRQDKMQNEAWKSDYRAATQSEIAQLKCRKDGSYQNTYFIKCSFADISISNYAKIKINTTLKDGTTKELEFLNYAPELKWKKEPLTGSSDIEVEKIDRKSLKIVYIK